MARPSFSSIFYNAAPSALARDTAEASANTEIEGMVSQAPAEGSWRVSPVPKATESPKPVEAAGYSPEPISAKASYAEILLDEIPKRIEIVQRKVRGGDYKSASAEREAIDAFVRDNSANLHKFMRYTGRDPATRMASERAMDLVSGDWLSEEDKMLFDPMNNPKSVQGWAYNVGASPRLTALMEAARNGDPEANAVMRASGADFRTMMSYKPQVQGQEQDQTGQPSPISPTELDAFVKFHDALTATVMPDIPAGSLTPDDMAGFSKKLFTASKDGSPSALGAMSKSFSGILPTDTPDVVKAKLRSGMEAASTIASVAVNKSVEAKSMLPAIADAIDSIKGGAIRVSGSIEQLRDVADRVLSAVDSAALLGNTVSQDQVSRLTRIEYSRAISDPTILKDPTEQAIAKQLQVADTLRAGLTTTDDPRSQLAQTREIDPRTGREFVRTATPDEAYPGLAVMKRAMDDTLSRAYAQTGLNGGDLFNNMQANRGRLASVLVASPGMENKEAATDHAADMILRYWSSEGRADMRTLYDDMYKKYHVDVDKASQEDTRAGLNNPRTAATVASAADIAAESTPGVADTADKRLYKQIVGGAVNLSGKWDLKPGDATWNSFVKATRSEHDTMVRGSTSFTSDLGTYLSGLEVGYVTNAKNSDELVTNIASKISDSVYKDAGKLATGFNRQVVDAAITDLSKMIALNLRDSESLKALASANPKAFLGPGIDSATAYDKLLFGEGDKTYYTVDEIKKLGISSVGLSSVPSIDEAASAAYNIKPDNARKALSGLLAAFTLKNAAGDVTSTDANVTKALTTVGATAGLATAASLTAGAIGVGNALTSGMSAVEMAATGLLPTTLPYGLGATGLAEAIAPAASVGSTGISMLVAPGYAFAPAAAPIVLAGAVAADLIYAGYTLYNAGLDSVQPKSTAGLPMRIKQYAVSMMGAPTMDAPSTSSIPTTTPRAATTNAAAERDLANALSPEAAAQLKSRIADKGEFYGGDAINWSLTGDQIVSGMGVIKASTDAAKRPVEDNIVRGIFADMRSDPTAYEYAQAMAARVKGPLNRSVALKVRSDAIKLANFERDRAKSMSESRRLILSAKLRDLAARRKGDEDENTPGMTDEEFDKELEALAKSAQTTPTGENMLP